MVYECFKIYYYYIESIYSNYRFRYHLEENDAFGAFWRSFELRWKQEMVDGCSSVSTNSHHQISIDVESLLSIDVESLLSIDVESLVSIDYEAIQGLMTN